MLVGISATRDAVAASVTSALARRAGYFMSAGIGARLLACSRSVNFSGHGVLRAAPARSRNTLVSGRSQRRRPGTGSPASDRSIPEIRTIRVRSRFAHTFVGRVREVPSKSETVAPPAETARSRIIPAPRHNASQARVGAGFRRIRPRARGVQLGVQLGVRLGGQTIRRYPRGLASEPSSMPAPTTPPATSPRPPNRRSRAPNARIARWKSARVKSGQSTSVT